MDKDLYDYKRKSSMSPHVASCRHMSPHVSSCREGEGDFNAWGKRKIGFHVA